MLFVSNENVSFHPIQPSVLAFQFGWLPVFANHYGMKRKCGSTVKRSGLYRVQNEIWIIHHSSMKQRRAFGRAA